MIRRLIAIILLIPPAMHAWFWAHWWMFYIALVRKLVIAEDSRKSEWDRSLTWRWCVNLFKGWDHNGNAAEGGSPAETISAKSGRHLRDKRTCKTCRALQRFRCWILGGIDPRHCYEYASDEDDAANYREDLLVWKRERARRLSSRP